ncbi:MAG: hypothetical protein M1812_007008 [Candelaria pacifica]|nr:MAG: hypothetical protein M1812_007008 [Candelaria pacifica]
MLQHVVELDGSEVAKELTLGEYEIVQKDPFAKGPNNEDFSGWTGNEGTTATHYYRSTVALLMPSAMKLQFLFESAVLGHVDVGKWIERSLQAYRDERSDKSREDLEELCDCVTTHNMTSRLAIDLSKQEQKAHGILNPNGYVPEYQKPFSDDVLGVIVKAHLQTGSLKRAQRAVSLISKTTPLWIFSEFGEALSKIGLSNMKSILDEAITHVPKTHERLAATEQLVKSYESMAASYTELTELGSLEGWRQDKTSQSLASISEVFKEDGEALVEIAAKYGNNMLFQSVLPVVKKFVSKTSFAIEFARRLFEAGEESKIPQNAVSNVFRDVLSDLIPAFTLDVQTSSSKSPRYRYTSFRNSRSETPDNSKSSLMKGGELADLIKQCISLNLEPEIDQILTKMRTEISQISPTIFESFIPPFLKQLLDILQQQKIPLSTPRYRSFYQQTLNTYIKKNVDTEPTQPENWKREKKGCGVCEDCKFLNEFLIDPIMHSTTFSMSDKRRKHIQNRIEPNIEPNSQYNKACSGFEINTIRTTKPYSLKIEKTENKWKDKYDIWEKRSKEVEKQFQGLGMGRMREVLGDRYDELVELRGGHGSGERKGRCLRSSGKGSGGVDCT